MNTALNKQEPDGTAYHEAGHAVVGRHVGLGVQRIAIIQDEDRLGFVTWRTRPSWDGLSGDVDHRTRRRVEQHIIASWAGVLAEEKATGTFEDVGMGIGRAGDGADCFAAEHSDVAHVLDLALAVSYSDDEASAYIEWLRVRTLGLLDLDFIWTRIEHVARALATERALSSSRFRAVLAAADQVAAGESLEAEKGAKKGAGPSALLGRVSGNTG